MATKLNDIKNTISVILPIHELPNEKSLELFKNALTSVAKQTVCVEELIIVYPKGSDVAKIIKDYDFSLFDKSEGDDEYKTAVVLLEHDEKTDFCSQVNYGVSKAPSDWISILEFDDEYSLTWFKNVNTYIEAHGDVEIFLPIVVDTNEAGQFIGLTNEASWANSFSDELGFLDNGALLTYQNFNIDGVVMKKELFETFGGFKSNIKLTFIYEFLLRMTFKDVRTMIIPRFGYKHMNQRVGSLFSGYKDEMTPVESNWWLAQAKKEYYFKTERDITYEEITD
tara:strand:- start:46059 stop:46904 length:846 start_codon:yes stop_codon:yes gene_type:complete